MSSSAKTVSRQLPSAMTFTIVETAALLGVSPSLVRLQIKRGELKAWRMGRRILIPRSALPR
jgi:excisionase family DNA binding protein